MYSSHERNDTHVAQSMLDRSSYEQIPQEDHRLIFVILLSLRYQASWRVVRPIYNALADLSRSGSWPFLACRSELPPMCFLLMKTFGTLRWWVISSRASWMAAPSPVSPCQHQDCSSRVREADIPIWSSSRTSYLAPSSLKSDLVALQ